MGFHLLQPAPYMFTMRPAKKVTYPATMDTFLRGPHYVWQVHANLIFDPDTDPPPPRKPETGLRIGVVQTVTFCRMQIAFEKNKAVKPLLITRENAALDLALGDRDFPFTCPSGSQLTLEGEVSDRDGIVNRTVIEGRLSSDKGFEQLKGNDSRDDAVFIGLHDADAPHNDLPDTHYLHGKLVSFDSLITFRSWIVAIRPPGGGSAAPKGRSKNAGTKAPPKPAAPSPSDITVIAATEPFTIMSWMEGSDADKTGKFGLFLVTGDAYQSSDHLPSHSENVKKLHKERGAAIAFTETPPKTRISAPGALDPAKKTFNQLIDEWKLRDWS